MSDFKVKFLISLVKFLIHFFRKLVVKTEQISELQEVLFEKLAPFNEEEHAARIESVREFLHVTLPELDKKFLGMPICEGGIYNYLILPSNQQIKIDFVVPTIPLFICIPDIRSASWDEARLRGISRFKWEEMQTDLKYIEQELPKLPTLGSNTKPNIIILKWADSVNHFSLKSVIFGDKHD